ncbi:MAG TPA: hypothetical protein VF746_31120 [Longimicrobium sp.]
MGGFALLEPQDLRRLLDDERARDMYLRALLLMEDIVCELWDQPSHSRFDEAEWETQGHQLSAFFDGEDGLSRNVRDNLERARDMREQVLVAKTHSETALLRTEATRFMRSLLFTYNQVRVLG